MNASSSSLLRSDPPVVSFNSSRPRLVDQSVTRQPRAAPKETARAGRAHSPRPQANDDDQSDASANTVSTYATPTAERVRPDGRFPFLSPFRLGAVRSHFPDRRATKPRTDGYALQLSFPSLSSRLPRRGVQVSCDLTTFLRHRQALYKGQHALAQANRNTSNDLLRRARPSLQTYLFFLAPFICLLSQHLSSSLASPQLITVSYMTKHPRDAAAISLALSLGGGAGVDHGSKRPRRAGDGAGEFVCKTCSRAFGSFQALGGHRTSHLRGRHGLALGMPAPAPAKDAATAAAKPAAASHQCHVCGLGFEMGQALGGHMRRHREEAAATTAQAPPVLLQLFV